jgi:hypothetical protein
MSTKYFFFGISVFFFALIPRIGFSQKAIDSLIKNLQNTHSPGVVIIPNKFDLKLVPITVDSTCNTNNAHHYLWFKNKLVIQIDGSGKLFEINPNKPPIRLDNTCYEGYNFKAFNFVYQDTIFSLGGYGFWVDNGLLRCYDEKNGVWYIIKTKKTLAFNTNTVKFYHDVADKKLYIIYQNPYVIIRDKSPQDDLAFYVQCLDLVTKTWWNDPMLFNNSLVPKLKNFEEFNRAGFNTNKGLLIDLEGEFTLFDFKNNKLNDIRIDKRTHLFNSTYKPFNKLYYSKDSSIHIVNSITGEIDSIPFGNADILASKTPIYLPLTKEATTKNKLQQLLPAIAMAIFFILCGFFIVQFRKKNEKIKMLTQKLESNSHSKISIQNQQSFKANLTEAENKLLSLLIKNSTEGLMTSVIQMNQVMELEKKPIKIQNNLRAAMVLMINKKFMVYSGTQDELFEKRRTEFDKRFFEYTIQRKYLSKIK